MIYQVIGASTLGAYVVYHLLYVFVQSIVPHERLVQLPGAAKVKDPRNYYNRCQGLLFTSSCGVIFVYYYLPILLQCDNLTDLYNTVNPMLGRYPPAFIEQIALGIFGAWFITDALHVYQTGQMMDDWVLLMHHGLAFLACAAVMFGPWAFELVSVTCYIEIPSILLNLRFIGKFHGAKWLYLPCEVIFVVAFFVLRIGGSTLWILLVVSMPRCGWPVKLASCFVMLLNGIFGFQIVCMLRAKYVSKKEDRAHRYD